MAIWKSTLESLVMLTVKNFWRGKQVLLTGHTGFKGSWLALWLQRLGAEVTGIALPPAWRPSLFELAKVADVMESHYCDVRDTTALAAHVRQTRPEIVFHLAAQSLVRVGYCQAFDTFATNVLGTASVLDTIRGLDSVRVVVVVTTDKVYRNREWPYPYREDDALGGYDPYSASKAASEFVVACYRESFLKGQGVAVATGRAGNVIGGGDWSQDRLIPDAIRAWERGEPLMVRRPEAIRPWQHVLEPLAGYLVLAEKLWNTPELAGAYNFGPDTSQAATVREVVELARKAYGRGDVIWGDGTEGPREARWLTLEIAKARVALGVLPRWGLAEAVSRTMSWYRRIADGADARSLCEADIVDYEASR